MHDFEILFDHGEPAERQDPAYRPYGPLGFPAPPAERPWTFSNFVQTLDGIASLKGKYASGFHISQSQEDRWLMDLLRAHADGILTGVNTLLEEGQLGVGSGRGPVYRIMDDELRGLRQRLGRGRETNIFVTGSASLDLSAYRVFDGDKVDAMIVTTREGAARLAEKKSHPHVRVIVAGEGKVADLRQAVSILRRDFGVRYLLCEGGPTLNGHMERAGLIDEKFLTVSPLEAGQQIPPEQEPSEAERAQPPKLRPTTFDAPGFTKEQAPWFTWVSCRKVGDHQFNRYRRRR